MCLFSQLNNIGKKGEQAVYNYYTAKGANVVDVSNNKEYQKADIDFLINNQTVEVKTGNNIVKYKEICIELESNSEPTFFKKGWFFTSKAEIVIYYSPIEKTLYEIGLEPLRELYNQNKNKYETKTIYKNEYANVVKPSRIAFIPIADIQQNIKFFRKTKIN